ncbi:MAG: AMP-binding protein [Planctomycetes bacterium]|nr:AMP-binding protein [Planctomycetota bacterium]NUQ35754.1 AMP-binding protein [Planctomycetaceae bacterium]
MATRKRSKRKAPVSPTTLSGGDNSLNPRDAQRAASAPLARDKKSPRVRWFDDPLHRPNEFATIRDAIEGQARRFKDKTYLIYEEDGSEYSYRTLDAETSRNVNLFRALSASKHARIGILDANTPDFVFLYMGCMKGAYTSAPLNYHLKGPELQFCLENSESELLFVSTEFWSEIGKILDQIKFLKAIVIIGPKPPGLKLPILTSIAQFQRAAAKRQPNDLPPIVDFHKLRARIDTKIPRDHPRPTKETQGEIIYTSGTTGKPKGVLLRHHQFLTDAKYISRWYRMKPETRMMMILPLFHVNAEVVTTMTPLVYGGSVVMFKKFSATRFWPTVEKYKVNIFSTVPTILSILVAREHRYVGTSFELGVARNSRLPKALQKFSSHRKEQEARRLSSQEIRKEGCAAFCDITSLQCCICGAAPLPAEVQLEWERTFLVPTIEGYGLSETTCYSTFNPTDGSRKIATIGVEVGNEVAIFGSRNRRMPTGQMGEIVIRGENVMLEYFKRPEANVDAFSGGWFHSGDVGDVDADGFVRIRDRVKDMIIRGGENIYPREIDEVLYTHPEIENAATIGVPDKKYGEEVVSFVVLKGGKIPRGADAKSTTASIIDYCRERLANFKVPKTIEFITEIPKGPTGKLLRRALRDMAAGK